MKFTDIDKSTQVYPGEYVLHVPSAAIVLVGAFNRKNNIIRAFNEGKLMEDAIMNFKKIEMERKEYKEYKKTTCTKCKGAKR